MSETALQQRARRQRQAEYKRRWRNRQKESPQPRHPGPFPRYLVQDDGFVLRECGTDQREAGHITSDGHFIAAGLAKERYVFLSFLIEQHQHSHRQPLSIQVRRWFNRCQIDYADVVRIHAEILEDQARTTK